MAVKLTRLSAHATRAGGREAPRAIAAATKALVGDDQTCTLQVLQVCRRPCRTRTRTTTTLLAASFVKGDGQHPFPHV